MCPAKKTKVPRDDAKRRRAAGCLDDSFLVEAGAGTGKTALLMDRLRNIICVRGIPMEEIAAITFTEKAAAELKSRLRSELDGWLEKADREERERARTALGAIDRAAVNTIHSFCSTLIRERPVEAGVDPGFAVVDQAGGDELRDWAWDSWLQERMVPENTRLRPVFSLGIGTQTVRELADSLLGQRDLLHFAPEASDLPAPKSFISEIKRKMSAFDDLAKRELKTEGDRLYAETTKVRSFLGLAEGRLVAGKEDAEEFWATLAPAMSGLSVKTKRCGSAANWRSVESLAAARELLADIEETIHGGAADYLHNAMVYLIEELGRYIEIYAKLKRDKGVLDFDDLLIVARDLLVNSVDVRRYYKRKYKAILIDEFQDTDPLQAEVAFLLAEKLEGEGESWDEVDLERGKLFIVGDPKQSIYRFRGADIEVYEKSKKLLQTAGEVLDISVNFRSTSGVIDPVNTAFETVMHPPEEGNYQPKYIPLESFREDNDPGVVLLSAGGDLPESPSAEKKRAYEASAIAWSIRNAVEKNTWSVFDKAAGTKRPARYGDIALLFRASTGLDYYEEALKSWDVPYRIAGGKAYYARAEVRALTSVLTAVESPHDGVAVVGALRSVFFGISDEEIFLQWSKAGGLNYTRVKATGPVEEAFEVLRELRGIRNSVRLVTFMRRLFESTGVLPSLYLRPQGEQRVANLTKMSAMATKLEESGPVTFKRFVRWVSDQGAREVDEGESPVREIGDDFVSILTIHKAKGLEFPVVYLPGLWSGGQKGRETVIVDREAGRLEVSLSRKLGLVTRDWGHASARESDVLEAERIRLLYVAMTRARDRIVLPCLFGAGPAVSQEAGGDSKKKKEKPGGTGSKKAAKPQGSFKYMESLLEAARSGARWADVLEVPPKGLEYRRERAHRLAGSKKSRSDIDSMKTEWKTALEGTLNGMATSTPVTSPTGLLEPFEEVVEGEEMARASARELSAGVGMKLGSLVHEVLERDECWDPEGMEKLARALGAEAGLPEGALDHAVKLLARFSKSEFAERMRGARSLHREVPFCSPMEARVEGYADLLVEEDDGWRVVDFKTDGVAEDEVAERADHYRLQGACYALCLSEILGQPVREMIFYFLSPGVAHAFTVDERLLNDARSAIAAVVAQPKQ
jgi:ATP-dependent exoDNAse (exonuclease V) beta subunit